MISEHKHHVIPRHEWKNRFGSLKGFNSKDNVVILSIEQHAQAHQLLFEQFNRHEDYVAWKVLSGQMSISTGREFMRRERIRAYLLRPEVRERNRQRMLGRIPWNKGISLGPMPESEKAKRRGKTPWNKGIKTHVTFKHTPETLEKIRQARRLQNPPVPKGSVMPEQWRQNISKAKMKSINIMSKEL
jgi:hypothetical protein